MANKKRDEPVEEVEWEVKEILAENVKKKLLKISWEGTDSDGKPWAPTWEPYSCASAFLLREWEEKKKAQSSMHNDALKALSPPSASAIDMASLLRGRKQTTRSVVLGDTFDLPVQTFDNSPLDQPIRAYEGETIMDALKRHELVEATCGGACECATCHIHLRPSKDGPAVPVSEADNEEEDQLEYAIGADNHSRLACQVRITDDLQTWFKEGGRVQLPRY